MTDQELGRELRKNVWAVEWLGDQLVLAESIRDGLLREADAREWTPDRIARVVEKTVDRVL